MDPETTTPAADTAAAATAPETATPVEAPVEAATEGETGLAGSVTELLPVEEAEATRDPLHLHRQAARSRLMERWFEADGSPRPISEWGLLAEGDAIDGHMILIDVDTLEKVRAYPGAKVPAGRLFCNGRNLPTSLLASL